MDGPTLFGDIGELYFPYKNKPMRRVAMSLLNTEQPVKRVRNIGGTHGGVAPASVGAVSSLSSIIATTSKQMNTVCQCAKCQSAPCVLVVTLLKKHSSSKRFIIPAPFRTVVLPDCPGQVRIFKESCSPDCPGICLVLVPKKSPADWVAAMARAADPNPPPPPADPLPKDCVKVMVVKDNKQQSVRIVNVLPKENGEKEEVSTVWELMLLVVARFVDAIPTRYALCFSGAVEDCVSWCVTDGGPVSLKSFAGETLYVFEKKIELSAAMDEYIAYLATAEGGGVNAMSQIIQMNEERGRWRNLAPGLLNSFICLGDRSIASFYDVLFRKMPPISLCHRLHGLDDIIRVKYGETTEFHIPVKNNTNKPLIVSAELSVSPLTVAYGVNIVVVPDSVIIPEGQSRDFRVTFYGTNPVVSSELAAKPYCIGFFATPLDPKTKSRLKDTPFIVPFKYTVLPSDVDDDKSMASLSFLAIDEMNVVQKMPSTQGCSVAFVKHKGRSYMRKGIPLSETNLHVDQNKKSTVPTTPSKGSAKDQDDVDPHAFVLLSLKEELSKMRRLCHPSIMRAVASVHDPRTDTLYLLFPFNEPMVSLKTILTTREMMSTVLRLKIAIDIAEGLRHLAHFNLSLGNLCLESVYVVSRLCPFTCYDGTVKTTHAIIGDFGRVGDLCVTRLSEFDKHTIPFVAPELVSFENKLIPEIKLEQRLPPSDIFSFGLILYSLLSGSEPYLDGWGETWNSIQDLLKLVANNNYRPDMSKLNNSSIMLVELINSCLGDDSLSRPTADLVTETLFGALNDILYRQGGGSLSLPPQTDEPRVDTIEIVHHKKVSSGSGSGAINVASVLPSPENCISQSPRTQQPHGTSQKSNIVRLIQDKDNKPPVNVRISIGTMGLRHLFDIFNKRHVDTNGMCLVDAQTMEEVTEGYFQQKLETSTKPFDVCLCPIHEIVEVNVSIVTDDETEPDNYVTLRVNKSALARDICLAAARSFKSEPLRLLQWDFSVVPQESPFLVVSDSDLEVPVDIVLARTSDLIPVTVSVTLSEKDNDENSPRCGTTQLVEMLFYKHVTVAAVFRIALVAIYKNRDIFSHELEFLDPLQQSIDEPASLTLQQCITRCGFVELPEGMTSYVLSANDGLPLKLSYSNNGVSSCCTVIIPPSGTTVEDLLSKAHSAMNLPGDVNNYFLANSSGFALLDNSAAVNRHFLKEGLIVSSVDHLMRVNLNDLYMMGFVDDENPTVATLITGVGFDQTTKVRYNEVMVQSSLPLVANGRYYLVEESELNSFVNQSVLLPNDEILQIRVSQECTAANLVEVISLIHPPPAPSADVDEELIPVLQDNTDCILADNLFAKDFSNTTLHYSFI